MKRLILQEAILETNKLAFTILILALNTVSGSSTIIWAKRLTRLKRE